MLENILYTLTETSLLLGICLLISGKILGMLTPKASFKIAKTSVFFSALFAVLFYNKGVLQQYFSISGSATLSYFITMCISYVWLQLSSKWFYAQKDNSAFSFCLLSLILMFLLDLLIKVNQFQILLVILFGLCIAQYFLFRYSKISEELYHTSRRYGIVAMIFVSLMLGAFSMLPSYNINFENMVQILLLKPYFVQMFVVLSILCCFLFMLGSAPFHFWFADSISPVVLPVATYFNVVPILALWSVFLKLNAVFFIHFEAELKTMYVVFGVFSILTAAIGANSSRFLRKIFAFSGLYQSGVILLLLSVFQADLLNMSYIYIELFVFLMLGIYICFYGMRLNGEYVNNLSSVTGIGFSKPYVTASLLFFIVFLAALPPLTGFIIQFKMLLNIAQNEILIYTILCGLLALMPAYLKIVEVMYFNKKEHSFDRVDPSIYLYLLVYVFFLIALFIKPDLLLNQTNILFGAEL